MNIFDNILDNYLYLYYTETYPRYDSLHGCSISFETQVCQGWEWIFLSERFMGPFYLEGLFGLNVHKLFYVSEFSKWSNQPKFIQLFGRIPQPALESIIYLYH